MTQPSFWDRFGPISVPMAGESRSYLPLSAPISVPIQGAHLVRKPYTLLIYQGVRCFFLMSPRSSRKSIGATSQEKMNEICI